jgi:hypothetical protein
MDITYIPHDFFPRSFGTEFWTIFGDISSLSSNIDNKRKTFNSPCNKIFLLLTLWLSVNENVISYKIYLLTELFTIVPMMLFTNFKLFIIARKNSSGSRLSPQTQRYSSFSSKHISSCLLALLCVIILSIPFVVYIVLKLYSEETKKFNNVKLAGYWARTILLLSNTFNSLIFYWKNKRAEGLKVIKGIKLYRPYPSQADN